MIHFALNTLIPLDIKRIANSSGLIVMHTRGRSSIEGLIERLTVFGPVVTITARKKTEAQIKTEIAAQYGKTQTLILDNFSCLPDTAYLEKSAEQMDGAFVIINRRNFKH